MKNIRGFNVAKFVGGTLIALSAQAWGADQTLKPRTRIWLEGDSTLHRFASTATVVNASLEFEAAPDKTLWSQIQAGKIKKLDVTVAAEGLKSGEGRLDKNLYAALKTKQFQDITFHMDKYEVASSSGAEGTTIQVIGKLSIAGKEKSLTILGRAMPIDRAVLIGGSYALVMSDYGIKPPSLMLGAIKVRDAIVVRFELRLAAEPVK